MDRIFAWIVDRLRWLFPVVVLIGAVFVYLGWTDSSHIREVSANGIEATAQVEGGTVTKRRRGGESYALKLSWRDAKGNLRAADSVHVTGTFARKVISGDRVTIDSVRIKYLPEAVDTEPIVLDDDPADQVETAEFMTTLGIGLAGGGVIGSVIMLLLSGRRRRAVASA